MLSGNRFEDGRHIGEWVSVLQYQFGFRACDFNLYYVRRNTTLSWRNKEIIQRLTCAPYVHTIMQ